MLRELMMISLGTAIINNFVLVQLLGVEPLFNSSKNLKSATDMGVAVMFVMIFASLAAWAVNTYVLVAFHAEFLRTFVLIIVVVATVQIIEKFSKRFIKSLYLFLSGYLRLITVNSVILGIILINVNQFGAVDGVFAHTMVNTVAAGVGFFIAIVLLAGVRERLELKNIPKPFRGIPIALISAGLIAMAFMGVS